MKEDGSNKAAVLFPSEFIYTASRSPAQLLYLIFGISLLISFALFVSMSQHRIEKVCIVYIRELL